MDNLIPFDQANAYDFLNPAGDLELAQVNGTAQISVAELDKLRRTVVKLMGANRELMKNQSKVLLTVLNPPTFHKGRLNTEEVQENSLGTYVIPYYGEILHFPRSKVLIEAYHNLDDVTKTMKENFHLDLQEKIEELMLEVEESSEKAKETLKSTEESFKASIETLINDKSNLNKKLRESRSEIRTLKEEKKRLEDEAVFVSKKLTESNHKLSTMSQQKLKSKGLINRISNLFS